MAFLAYTDTGPRILAPVLLFLGIIPYLLSIHLIEPWLSNRNTRNNQTPDE